MKKERIGILTGGGDCPGINAVIRAVTKRATYEKGMEVIGIEDGYQGMIENRPRENTWKPPLSVRIGRGHAMNRCSPPRRAISSWRLA